MPKIDFTFKGFRITYQQNNTHNLVLIVSNDMAASIIQPILSIANDVTLDYLVSNDYFDLLVNVGKSTDFYQLSFSVNNETNLLAQFIDAGSITELWIGYFQNEKLLFFSNSITLHPG